MLPTHLQDSEPDDFGPVVLHLQSGKKILTDQNIIHVFKT